MLQSYSLLRDLQVPSSSTQLPPATHPPRLPYAPISSSAPSLIDTKSLGSLWMRKPCWRSTLLPPWLQRSLPKTIVAGCSGGYLGQRCVALWLCCLRFAEKGRKWPPLIHLFPADSIYYCLCIAHRSCSCILSSFLAIYSSVISGPQVFRGFILCRIPVVKDIYFFFLDSLLFFSFAYVL